MKAKQDITNIRLQNFSERVDLAATLRWTARLDMHEAVANHFSVAVNGSGTRFLINPKQRHFSRIRASDLLLVDANDPAIAGDADGLDPTAWGLHGAIHRHCPHARCVMHVHPTYATVLASLADSNLPPIDQTTMTFYNRYVIDESYGGLALESEGERCARLLSDPGVKVLIMGNHGVLTVGDTVADCFHRLYYFERAAGIYIRALQTGQKLRVVDHDVAEKTAREIENYSGQAESHLSEIKAILDAEASDYAA